MTEEQDFFVDLRNLDNYLTEHPFKKDIIWRILEKIVAENQKVGEFVYIINELIGLSAGHVIAFLLRNDGNVNTLLEYEDYANKSYFKSLALVFTDDIIRLRLLETDPLHLLRLDLSSGKENFSLSRADGERMTFSFNDTTFIYLLGSLLEAFDLSPENLNNIDFEEVNKIKLLADSISLSLAPIIKNHGESDDQQ